MDVETGLEVVVHCSPTVRGRSRGFVAALTVVVGDAVTCMDSFIVDLETVSLGRRYAAGGAF